MAVSSAVVWSDAFPGRCGLPRRRGDGRPQGCSQGKAFPLEPFTIRQSAARTSADAACQAGRPAVQMGNHRQGAPTRSTAISVPPVCARETAPRRRHTTCGLLKVDHGATSCRCPSQHAGVPAQSQRRNRSDIPCPTVRAAAGPSLANVLGSDGPAKSQSLHSFARMTSHDG